MKILILIILLLLVGCGADCEGAWDWSLYHGYKRTDQIGYCVRQEHSMVYDEETERLKSVGSITSSCYDSRKALTRLEKDNRYLIAMEGGDELFHREKEAKERIKRECKGEGQ